MSRRFRKHARGAARTAFAFRNWSSRFFATSSGAVAQTLVTRVFLLGINLITGVIVAKQLAPNGRGELAAIILWPGLMSGLLTLGLPQALVFNTRRATSEKSGFLYAATVLATALGFFALFAGFILIPRMLTKYDSSVVRFAQLIMLIAPFSLLTFVFQAELESRGRFKDVNLGNAVPQVITLLILATLIVERRMTPFSAALAYLAPWSILTMVLAWQLRKDLFRPHVNFLAPARSLLSYGIRSYIVDVLGTLSSQIDQVLVVGLLTARGLGLYAVALSISRVLGVLNSSILTVLFPRASGLSLDEIVILTGRSSRIGTFLSLIGAAVLIPGMPFLVRILYGKSFSDVSAVAQILCLEMVVSGYSWILAQTFMAIGKPGTIAMLELAGLALTIPLMLLLIPRFGLPGAAIALLLSSTSRICMIVACYPLILKVNAPRLLIGKDDVLYIWAHLSRKS